jgi:predicted permease
MEALRHDLRYAFRALLHRPAFSALAVLTLAIGIGVNTVAFSAINALFAKPLRFPDAQELGWIQISGGRNPYHQASLPDYLDIARENRTFEAIIAEARIPLGFRAAAVDGLPAAGAVEQAWGLLVSANYLDAMRARPIAGRLFSASDVNGSEVPVVVSERFWVDRLGGGESIAGRTITLNGREFSIVGILPEGFQGPGGLYEPDVWLPLARLELLNLSPRLLSRDEPWLGVVGRMKRGVTSAQALADLRGIMGRLATSYPATNADRTPIFIPVTQGVPELRRLARLSWLGLGVVGIVLLIACFNVAGLLLARTSERQREIGVRTALGARRSRILRQLVTEGMLLAALSGAASLLLAAWSADLLSAFSLPSPIPQRLHIGLDRRLVMFTLALVATAGILPALIPALQMTRADVLKSLRRESPMGGHPSWLRNAFVVAQVAGSTLFLASALLFVRSFLNSTTFAPGYDTAHTLVLELTPSSYGYDAVRSQRFFEQLVDRLERLPGIDHAALTDRTPFSIGFPKTLDVSRPDETCSAGRCRSATEFGVSPGHFAALGLPLLSGRDLNEQEYRSDAPVAVISASMASAFWPGDQAVGQSLRTGRGGRLVEIVGVVGDVKDTFTHTSRWYLYRPLRPAEFGERIAVVMHTPGEPETLLAPVQQQVQALAPELPAAGAVNTTRDRMQLQLWPARTAAGFFLICGTLALVLATVGLFGVTFYTVSQRTREFGVRVALGASSQNVMSLVLREGLTLALPGVVLGIGGALVAMRLLSRALYGVGPADPGMYAVTASVQFVVALAACILPAYRASKSDPMVALRYE